MKRLSALVLALCLPTVAAGEVALVRGGEHPEFTRIVVDAVAPGDWRLGRTDDGYELQLGPEVSGYDLAQAFERIPRDRVSALWRDPASGRLRFSLSCACYAIAFEFRPGVVVIDIKTGQPPQGSAFEVPLDPPATAAAPDAGAPEPPAEAEAAPSAAPAAAGDGALAYDWIDIHRDTAGAPAEPTLPLPFEVADPRLDPLRAALLAQISRGAAEGVVEMAEHPVLPKAASDRSSEGPGMRIVNGDLPGMIASGVHDPGPNLTPEGQPCLADSDLAVTSWMLPGPIAEQMGPGRAGLLGEFDTPEPDAIRRAARLYIALGFGAEARQYLDMLPDPDAEEARLLRAMAHVADQEPGGEAAFVPMAGCDTAAALWSALTLTAAGEARPSQIGALNLAAVGRSFSALPVHLRRYFGPPLVEMFLQAGKDEAARLIRDAILRAPGEAGPDVALMDAQYDLATGDGHEAVKIAGEVAREAGSAGPEALVTLVEAAFQSGSPLPPDLPATLMAYRADARGTALEVPLRRASLLAAAMLGDFTGAFAELHAAPDSAADLWALAATRADDDLFLAEAVSAAAEGHPAVAADVALAIAQRLLDLGFAGQALAWLGPVDTTADLPRRLVAARAALALGDARAALALVSGLGDAEAERLRAAAVLQLGDAAAAAEALHRAGDAAAGDRALSWTEDWAKLAESGADPWKSAAALADAGTAGDAAQDPAAPPDPVAAPGPLARGNALVADSAAARAAVDALLTSVAAPATP